MLDPLATTCSTAPASPMLKLSTVFLAMRVQSASQVKAQTGMLWRVTDFCCSGPKSTQSHSACWRCWWQGTYSWFAPSASTSDLKSVWMCWLLPTNECFSSHWFWDLSRSSGLQLCPFGAQVWCQAMLALCVLSRSLRSLCDWSLAWRCSP